jgi:hypothetical protein
MTHIRQPFITSGDDNRFDAVATTLKMTPIDSKIVGYTQILDRAGAGGVKLLAIFTRITTAIELEVYKGFYLFAQKRP